ncbi:MAG: Small subunit (SSU) processome component [Pleopsidium flavum]|nr:MAG: Small subunit (SSU) processome component [Pleopsidium flavum]
MARMKKTSDMLECLSLAIGLSVVLVIPYHLTAISILLIRNPVRATEEDGVARATQNPPHQHHKYNPSHNHGPQTQTPRAKVRLSPLQSPPHHIPFDRSLTNTPLLSLNNRLLRKVDFTKSDNNHRDAAVLRRYVIQKPDDYAKYNRLCGSLRYISSLPPHPSLLPLQPTTVWTTDRGGRNRQLAHRLSSLDPSDPFRLKHESLLLSKLHDMAILNTSTTGSGSKLSAVEHASTVSAFARRRLPVVMTRLKMADTVQAATKFVEQGHVRVGTEVVTDGAFCVTRGMEDWVTWVEGSRVKRNVMRWKGGEDDFELL